MKLPKISISNYRFTLLVFLLLALAGVNSYLNMPRTENPEITIPGASIYVIYPGANPADLEELVVRPLEEALNELDDIKEIRSRLKDGIASISIEFDFDNNAEKKYDEVLRQINEVKPDLPDAITSIKTFRWSSSDVIMLQLALVSEQLPYDAMYDRASDLKKELSRIDGIKKIEIQAYPKQEVSIMLDFEKIAGLNISLQQIENAIKYDNINIPGGQINMGNKVFGVKTSESLKSIDEIKNIVVQNYQGKLVYLSDIAKIDYAYKKDEYLARFNGEKAVWICVQQKEGLNIFKLFDKIEPVISNFQSELEPGVRLETVFNQKNEVTHKINNFQLNLVQGIILVGLIIFLFLGYRSALIVMISIPLSIILSFFVVDVSGYGLQQISIAGLVVALGLLVDNSIVMIENINRFLAKGLPPVKAAVSAASEIGWPIVSATATTVLAFIPIIMMPDKAGVFIRTLPLIILSSLVFSLLIALSLAPLISSKILKKPELTDKRGPNKYLQRFVSGTYRKTLSYALHHQKSMIILSAGILVLSLLLAYLYLPISFFPKAEKSQFLIRIELPENSRIEKTDSFCRQVEEQLLKLPEIAFIASNTGNGNPRIYYNMWTKSHAPYFAEIFVQMKDAYSDQTTSMVNTLREQFGQVAGAIISLKEFEQGVPVEAPIEIQINGPDYDILAEIADTIEQKLKEQVGAINIVNQLSEKRTDLHIKIDKDRANLLGISIAEANKAIRTALVGWNAGKLRDKDGNEFDITLHCESGMNTSPKVFNKIYVNSYSQHMIPLSEIATIEFVQVPNIIARNQMERTAIIQADLKQGATLDETIEPVLELLKSYPFPGGYHYKIAGELENRQETFGGMTSALIIAIIAIFSVLVLQFKSFKQPFIIFVAVPFALIGMIVALLLSGNSFSFTAFVGLISLVGIVINNSIILVDYTNRLRAEGNDKITALKIAGETRFTPILLTTLTTIAGIVPLTLGGGSLWAPLGWTIIGGLTLSTVLTLVLVPIFYNLMSD